LKEPPSYTAVPSLADEVEGTALLGVATPTEDRDGIGYWSGHWRRKGRVTEPEL